MITITPPTPIDTRVQRPQVSSKDPHHDQSKGKKKNPKKTIEDKITIEQEPEENKKKSPPPSPLEGHIDIEA